MLAALILILLVAGLLAWPAQRWGVDWPRWIALGALVIDLVLVLAIARHPESGVVWLAETHWRWIPRFGITVYLALDGFSLLLIVLTLFLGIMAVGISWREIGQGIGFFHFNLLLTLAGALGVFLALDLFLFFLFWELMLVPMYFLVALWGHEARYRAAIKFFIFTQGGGLLMLVAILALVLVHQRQTGILTFNYAVLLDAQPAARTSYWIMLGFFIAFAVKLPVVPFHPWLPDTHTQASTGGSVILAGVLLKTAAYGMVRYVVQLFPGTVDGFAPIALALAVAGILYGAVLAFAQTDLKRLVAYTSVSHMGFVLLGVFAGSALALQGAVMQMVAHGIITPGLFMVVGALQERLHTRDMRQLGGLWSSVPRFGAMALFLAMAVIGLPGLAGFVGEFMVLVGAFKTHPVFAAIAALGMITAVIYATQLVQRSLHGERRRTEAVSDLSPREMLLLSAMAVAIVVLGLYPGPVFDTLAPFLAISEQGLLTVTGM